MVKFSIVVVLGKGDGGGGGACFSYFYQIDRYEGKKDRGELGLVSFPEVCGGVIFRCLRQGRVCHLMVPTATTIEKREVTSRRVTDLRRTCRSFTAVHAVPTSSPGFVCDPHRTSGVESLFA